MASSDFSTAKQLSNSVPSDENAPKAQSLAFYYKLISIYLLNIVDWLCTEALISTGRFYEANPFMKLVLENFWLTVLIKGIVPLVLIALCAVIYRLMDIDEIGRLANAFIYFGIIAYSMIIIWHIANFVLLFFVF